jgi:adenosine deaminase
MRLPACLLACIALAVTPWIAATQTPGSSAASAETRAARAFQSAVQEGPLTVQAFLVDFPKGADLHVHLSGAVYAESFIRAAGEDGLCVDPGPL